MKTKLLLLLTLLPTLLFGQHKFAQLKEELATPNVYRNAAGAPGHEYYQQKADYKINVSLNDSDQTIHGEETITYTNNSPDQLTYLWVQLDQNRKSLDSDSKLINVEKMENFKSVNQLELKSLNFDGGFKIKEVRLSNGEDISYFINKTMLRINLNEPLKTNSSISFNISWWYNINDRDILNARSGFEYFPKDKNYLYTIAQWFPRMCVYNDVEGWQNKQFLGAGEFTLPFGDYEVNITVPSGHVVTATGELQNQKEILTKIQLERLEKARNASEPIFIITPEEALKSEKLKTKALKTWSFKAENVRDFAFASSRKFIWDAQGVDINGKNILAMSFYPKEGNPLWERYSTKLVAHTLKVYSKYTIDYPYPVAISVHTKWMGMEYPMICFNGGRPNDDGTYSEQKKYSMWGVIIHEVGHNFFPMIINSDERQWTWMDEGLNTFVQYLTEQEWERNYPSKRGPANKIVNYMSGDKNNISPIMTNSESILQFGNNSYGKPATALNVLRETVMGRELFDYSFKVYCERWKFKHPTPADFFRTMEDASSVDLDWFWRGWFYSTDNVDVALSNVRHFITDSISGNKKVIIEEKVNEIELELKQPITIGTLRNLDSISTTLNEKDTSINDHYGWKRKKFNDSILEFAYNKDINHVEHDFQPNDNKYYYELTFNNIGGLVSPIIIRAFLENGTTEIIRIPAEIWLKNDKEVSKVFVFKHKVKGFQLDPFLETADTNISNNVWPARKTPSRYKLFMKNKK
jgi:hypothetical protein